MKVLGVWLFCTTLLKEEKATPGRSRASSLLLVLCVSDPIPNTIPFIKAVAWNTGSTCRYM